MDMYQTCAVSYWSVDCATAHEQTLSVPLLYTTVWVAVLNLGGTSMLQMIFCVGGGGGAIVVVG